MWFEIIVITLLAGIFIALVFCACKLDELTFKPMRFDYISSPPIQSTKKQVEEVYICDRKACIDCSYPSCKYTKDVKHAVNFVGVDQNKYMEDWKNAPSDKFTI